jgi:transcriptional regulator with PAS, ATPase and Fis domain
MEDWSNELSCAVTVTNTMGEIIHMNRKAQQVFEKWGGKELIGKSMYSCHNAKSQAIIHRLMEKGETNVYTIEKKGVKKLIYQTPWRKDGEIAGLVEFSFEIPFDMPHFVRE